MTELAIQVAAALARRFEGCYLRPYLCQAGVATIGYGATYYENGHRVTLFDPAITRERAEQLLAFELQRVCLPQVLRLCPGIDSPERLAAIIDFAFNCGTGNLRASTLRRKINAGEWGDVPAQLLRWNRGGGRILRGLTLRRQAESDLI